MKCQEYQKLIIQSDENNKDDKKALLDEHLKDCKDCQQFNSQFQKIRFDAQAQQSIKVPETVDRDAHAICMDWLNSTQVPLKDPLKKLIYIITPAVVLLTLGFIVWGYWQGYHEIYPALGTIFWAILFQNILMLLLSPLLLRIKFRQWRVDKLSHQNQTSAQLLGLLF